MTPNQRTKVLLESEGWLTDIVERWIPHTPVTKDLFGVFDVLGVSPEGTIAVQATTADHISHRRKKLADSMELPKILAAGWRVEIHGWHKVKGRWQVKREGFKKIFL